MRADSPLSPAQHEVIAAHVSRLNACQYCYGVHSETARAFGAVDDAKMKPMVFAAGWSERALHDAVLTTCLFNFMNRLLEGHGCHGNAEVFASRGKALKEEGYRPLLKLLE